jgi:Bifunctional DNA primase/polymerase, N-terminal/AAA domain/Primase C terminal 1 (PriCT-1)
MPFPTEHSDAAPGDMLGAALDYAARGWHVFPLKPRSKVPATLDGFKSATLDAEQIAAWWKLWPQANVGIRTGSESGLVVLDVDAGGGAGSLKRLEAERGKLPQTAEALTGSGGRHYLFAYPGHAVPNSAGKLAEKLDVRGDGGYIVAPPSAHESGRAYRWMRPPENGIAEPPAWLLESGERSNGAAPQIGEVIKTGERDSTLASLAGSMRRRGMDGPEILAALEVTNRERCKPPLPQRDVERIARSIGGKPSEKERQAQEAEPFALEVLTARALCLLPDPPGSDHLLGPLLVRGQRLILGGHTGEGKTTLALQLVRAAVEGSEALDWQGSGELRALIIDAEQGLKTIKRRLAEAGLADSEHVDYVRVPDGLELDSDERHVAEVERLLTEGGYGLVVADPLYKLHTGDSNAEREAVDLMRRFDAWRERYRFALLLPVHCRKPQPGTKFSIHDLFGSSAYVRGAEVVLGLQRAGDGCAKLHWLKDRDGDLPIGTAWRLLFSREDGFRRDPKDGEPPTAERVAALRAEDPALTQEQVADRLALTPRTVRKYWHDDEPQETLDV